MSVLFFKNGYAPSLKGAYIMIHGKYGRVLGMVLAGGKGERLMPLTRYRAKPAVPFGAKYRIIDFALSQFTV